MGKYDVLQLAKRETENWLNESCGGEVSIEELVGKHLAACPKIGKSNPDSKTRYSVSQLCEIYEKGKLYLL